MAPKKVIGFVKLQVTAGAATPAPPVGTALGPQGVNIMDFCKQFNARTQNQAGMTTPVEVTIYHDRSFTFITKTPPAAALLKKFCFSRSAAGYNTPAQADAAPVETACARSGEYAVAGQPPAKAIVAV